MAETTNAPRRTNQGASRRDSQVQDTAPRYIRNSPKSQCRRCHPRRMTPAEIERGRYPEIGGGDDA